MHPLRTSCHHLVLQAIANLGGWLLMMGQHDRSESLFYYFRIEDEVPENHLLRFIDRYVGPARRAA
ncbi:MAG: hypothetical protein WA847_00855 [Terriglobales bacterium]